ncbi:hypothetical protein ACFSRY_18955 [Pontibacter locisalis]|uniref:Uncharacterized protein n=1 Tax=Pontibacter locisalis TaxID=1719035 RepID=A0ABW5IT76_9BACT
MIPLLAGCGPYTHTVRQVPVAAQEKEQMLNDSTILLAAGKHYQTGKLHTFLFGKHYRDTWATPVPVMVLDLEREKGGLTPVKQGGSRQTLNRSGRNLDELLLAEFPREAWLTEAKTFKALLTDEIIENAFRELPDTIYALTADRIIEKLKSRREQLPRVAEAYFESLSREADIVGSDKHE